MGPATWSATAMNLTATLLVLAVALALDGLAGYPRSLFAAIGHPVTWIGALIAALDRRFNDETVGIEQRRRAGVGALLLLLIVTGAVAFAAEAFLVALPGGIVLLAVALSSLTASKSLDDHVAAVADALDCAGLAGGRRAVSMIVGRSPEALDEHGVCRAAIESLAENYSDGVVAPAFWFTALGLTGAGLYKAINTADSMIGHRTPRHEAFGWAAARLDDVVNLPASRLSAMLLIASAAIVSGADATAAWRAVRRDAGRHRSPNAGWPEAAMAGALGLRIGGPRVYGTARVDDPFMGEGRAEATSDDVRRALEVYRVACLVQLGLLVAIAGLVLSARW
jgi:adenosylcobinamide-phosphate synthase